MIRRGDGGTALSELSPLTIFLRASKLCRVTEIDAGEASPWGFDMCGRNAISHTMMAHGVRHLATRNAADFRRYGNLLSVEAVAD